MDEGTEFIGELRFRDTFRIDGRLKGKIVSDNTLIVGESGQVEAEIDCGVVSIRGTRQRPGARAASASSCSPARACRRTLVSPRLVIEEGAFFQGECDMGSAAAKGAVVPMAPGLRPTSVRRRRSWASAARALRPAGPTMSTTSCL